MTDLTKFGAVILAAGLSRRMGGPNKLLAFYLGKPLLAHALGAAAGLGLLDCVVVTGRDAEAVAEMAAPYRVRLLHNEAYEEGLGGSIAMGASQLADGVSGIFIALGDMPEVRAADYSMLAGQFRPGSIVLPTHGGQKGHPVLFCASYREELARLSGDEGARSIVKRHADHAIEATSLNPGVLFDLDRPEDFHAAQSLP